MNPPKAVGLGPGGAAPPPYSSQPSTSSWWCCIVLVNADIVDIRRTTEDLELQPITTCDLNTYPTEQK